MNNPPYYIVDVFAEIVERARLALALPVLNYQYGYVSELSETLMQWSQTEEYATKKYPLVWLRQPFKIDRNTPQGFYGSAEGLSYFVINETSKDKKAKTRMDENFKPIIYPIYLEVERQLDLHEAISLEYNRRSVLVDRYYWGPEQQAEINDIVDCLEVSELKLIIHDNQNC